MARKVKYKSIFKEIPMNPYSVTLWVMISNDCQKTVIELAQKHPGLNLPWGNDYAAWTEDVFYNDNYLAVIFDRSEFNEGTVAHEAIHIKNLIMQHAGIKHDFKNDEPEAYITQQIVDEIYNVWKEYKKK